MKKKFKLEKKKRGYEISSINTNAVKVTIYILAGKVMQKCCVDEVLTLVVAFGILCAKGI